MSNNRSNQQRMARSIASKTGMTYAQALEIVRSSANAETIRGVGSNQYQVRRAARPGTSVTPSLFASKPAVPAGKSWWTNRDGSVNESAILQRYEELKTQYDVNEAVILLVKSISGAGNRVPVYKVLLDHLGLEETVSLSQDTDDPDLLTLMIDRLEEGATDKCEYGSMARENPALRESDMQRAVESDRRGTDGELGEPGFRVLQNPAVTAEIVRQLLGSPNEFIRKMAAENTKLYKSLMPKLAKSDDAKIRAGLADNEFCPENLLKQLAQDEEQSVRSSVALNMSTPREILDQLAQDPVAYVADAAKRTINRHRNLHRSATGEETTPKWALEGWE